MSQARTVLGGGLDFVRQLIGNNRRLAYATVALAIVLWLTGNLPNVEIPSWWPVAVVLIGAAILAGKWAAKRIQELLPDPEGILIVALDETETGGGAIYELSEAAFEDLEVAGGDLFAWDRSPRRVYEVRSYDPVNNVAKGNWRESKPASALLAEETGEDAMAAVEELRTMLEPDVAEARRLKRHMRGIVRQLDKDRAAALDAILDEHVTPTLGDSRSIAEVIEDVVSEEELTTTPVDRNGEPETDDQEEDSDQDLVDDIADRLGVDQV